MNILLLNNRPLNFEQAVSLLKVLKDNYPEIYISDFLAFGEAFRHELISDSKDILVFATAFQNQHSFAWPYTGVINVRNFPSAFLEQNNHYSIVEYKEIGC